jgi:hypothetical protein
LRKISPLAFIEKGHILFSFFPFWCFIPKRRNNLAKAKVSLTAKNRLQESGEFTLGNTISRQKRWRNAIFEKTSSIDIAFTKGEKYPF